MQEVAKERSQVFSAEDGKILLKASFSEDITESAPRELCEILYQIQERYSTFLSEKLFAFEKQNYEADGDSKKALHHVYLSVDYRVRVRSASSLFAVVLQIRCDRGRMVTDYCLRSFLWSEEDGRIHSLKDLRVPRKSQFFRRRISKDYDGLLLDDSGGLFGIRLHLPPFPFYSRVGDLLTQYGTMEEIRDFRVNVRAAPKFLMAKMKKK